jgi:hypothetical protein
MCDSSSSSCSKPRKSSCKPSVAKKWSSCDGDRDQRFLMQTTGHGPCLQQKQGLKPGTLWGGALRRMVSQGLAPSREDQSRYVSDPGRYVPIGFARYASPIIDPTHWDFYRVGGWRVAVPRATPGFRTKDLLYRIFYYGPLSAGYIRLGDTLVPSMLEPGDRMLLANTATEFEPYPVGP